MSKSIKTHQDQEPSTQQVLFWLPLSCPQGFFCFLKKLTVASSQRSPQAPWCSDTVVLHCDLAVPKLATLDALIKVPGRRCREDDCMAAPEQPHWMGASCPCRGVSCTRWGMWRCTIPHDPGICHERAIQNPQWQWLPLPRCPVVALQISRRWAPLGKSRGCSQSGHQSHCHTATA